MVHHGYKRPGIGSIVGDCWGVGFPAYEISSVGCVEYRKHLGGWIADVERTLHRYEGRPPEITIYSTIKREDRTFRRDSDDPSEQRRYASELQSLIRQTEYLLKDLQKAHERMRQLIVDWVLRPLTEIDEEGFTQADRDARVARKDERSAKREEQARKRAELQAKRNERLANRSTTLLFFYDEFERLARQQPSASRTAYARDLLIEAAKKKHGVSYPWGLFHGPDDGYGNHAHGPWGHEIIAKAYRTLIALGVARPVEGRSDYAEVHVYAPPQRNKIRVPEPDPNKSAEEILDEIANRQISPR